MDEYESQRKKYQPTQIKLLFIAESPPPVPAVQSSRQFYYTDRIRKDDRLFVNMMRALYPEAEAMSEPELEAEKAQWLQRFQKDGYFMIEALTASQEHAVTKKQRQERIRAALPDIIRRVGGLCSPNTKLILIKSNVFEVAATPLREAGYTVLNTELVDYPGRFNQSAFKRKVHTLTQATITHKGNSHA